MRNVIIRELALICSMLSKLGVFLTLYTLLSYVCSAGDGKSSYDRLEYRREKNFFKHHYQSSEYHRFSGNIQCDSTSTTVHINFDTLKVYLLSDARKYVSMFTSGLLSAKNIYCCLEKDCRIPIPPIRVNMETGEKVTTPRYLGISFFTELKYAKSRGKHRRFKLWVNSPGMHGHDIVFIELVNRNAHRGMSFEEFVQGASLTFIKHAWSII